MSRRNWIPVLVVVPVAGFLWAWSASIRGGIGGVFLYSIAGAATGIVIGTTGRAFASAPLDRASVFASGILGFVVLTPVLAAVMTDSTDVIGASLILLVSGVSIAAIAGALWSVIDQMGDAFVEWRHAHNRLTPGGAHR